MTTGNEKECTRCHVVRPLDDYYWDQARSRHKAECKDCFRARARAWKQRQPRRDPELIRADLTDRPEWQDAARCRETDPELWYPEKGYSPREAKRICGGCEVRAECLAHALERPERYGIWGGLTARQRRPLTAPRELRAAS